MPQIVLSAQHLFTHPGVNFDHEVQDRRKAEVSSFAASIVICVFDAPSTSKRVHTRVNIVAEVESLLCLGYTA